jgi:WD40 repeat protein
MPNAPASVRLTLDGTKTPSLRLAWSPLGNLLATATEDGSILIWDTRTGKRFRTLPSNAPMVTNVAWSPDQKSLAFASADIWLHELESGRTVKIDAGHQHSIWSLAWSPDGNLIASGSHDRTIRIWNCREDRNIRVLRGHLGEVTTVLWSNDGRTLASASDDQSVKLWDTAREQNIRTFRGHADTVNSLAWSRKRPLLASASNDRTIVIWNTESGKQEAILEGHTAGVKEVSFSSDGQFLSSISEDGMILIWRCDTMERVASIPTQHSLEARWIGLAFHPIDLVLASADRNSKLIRLWDLHRPTLLQAPKTAVAFYRNARVVLLGDTGVGKSSLGFVLVGKSWDSEAGSTHGRRVWLFDAHEISSEQGRSETREIFLWDLAGQPDYRLIHQLHLTDIAVALMLFDARSSTDPFSGIRHWQKALQQAERVQGYGDSPAKKFLVAAREDVGRVSVSDQRIEALARDLECDGVFRTSAKGGWGTSELKDSIKQIIDWESIPTGSTTESFQRIKTFLLAEKESGLLLSSMEDLFHTYTSRYPALGPSGETRAQFETCIRLLESRDLIQRLSFGNLVLLQPELLDFYAAALVSAAKDEPDGLGCIAETDARHGDFKMVDCDRMQNAEQEALLLIATVEELLRHEVALRDGQYLIFPSQLTRENPDLPEPKHKDVIYRFDGPVLNVYATLAVRLSHSVVFKRSGMWKNAVVFKAKGGGACGIYRQDIDEGRAEITLFFDEDASLQTRYQFDDYIRTHLSRWALPDSIFRRRIFRCINTNCLEEITPSQAHRRRQLGHQNILCPVCETTASLLDWEERMVGVERASLVPTIDDAADFHRDQNASASVIHGKKALGEFDVFLCHNSADKHDVKRIGKRLMRGGILPWLDEWELRPGLPWQAELQRVIAKVSAAAVFVGNNGIGPWQDEELSAFLRMFVKRGCPVIPVLLPTPTGIRGLGTGPSKLGGRGRVQLREALRVQKQPFPELPVFLAGRTWVDFRKKSPDPLERLIWGITGKQK